MIQSDDSFQEYDSFSKWIESIYHIFVSFKFRKMLRSFSKIIIGQSLFKNDFMTLPLLSPWEVSKDLGFDLALLLLLSFLFISFVWWVWFFLKMRIECCCCSAFSILIHNKGSSALENLPEAPFEKWSSSAVHLWNYTLFISVSSFVRAQIGPAFQVGSKVTWFLSKVQW